ncbi:DUF6344 domain-containing protein [Actinacidiphila sp. ITFR-21]|uniref:DUF6344 domain-containing protein n=1 Tax=Actinacidiphila sp. ITFR-21 TaxID=3075199 RepID=UPI00288A33CD|nr:DUF6344 domain-containing protein [Streptomyces sp. ITFR-21]WNI16568.1 DUF6344 domain-containing protein [Streptomyces sp. ITFR-21]
MNAAVEARTFWSALLGVLLKCIAALGFTTPAARRTARGPVALPAATTATDVRLPRIPAPRGCEPVRRRRERTLPPTMKQRIRAEAHGSSPSARSVRHGDPAEQTGTALALADAAAHPGAASSGGRAAAVGAGPGDKRPFVSIPRPNTPRPDGFDAGTAAGPARGAGNRVVGPRTGAATAPAAPSARRPRTVPAAPSARRPRTAPTPRPRTASPAHSALAGR